MSEYFTNERSPEQPLSAGLDYYKLTMGDVIYEQHPDAEVTFTLRNRNHTQPLSEYISVSELQKRLDTIRENGFSSEEIAYFAGLKAQNGEARFTPEYLDHLSTIELPPVNISTDPETCDLNVDTTGPWTDVSLWETVVMSEVNELYFKNLMESYGLSLEDLYAEGDRRLDEKIAKLKTRRGIKFADFGTRRRFSLDWHKHVVARLKNEMSEQFIGTSNPWFAYKYNLAPIGTFAHEMPMVYAAMADAEGGDPMGGHGQMLHDWQERYGSDLSTALTDTFTTDFFFADFNEEQTALWNGLRHDSGDPFEFTEKALTHYKKYSVDPLTKTIVFSDGLDVDTIIELYDYCEGRIQVTFGWGTNLMNDLGLPANNFVMKATAVDGTPTVKLSDDIGKHTGPVETVEHYKEEVTEHIYAAV